MFALPNRLMMECEQYDANVFEVIELINRDYPRGGMQQPGFTAGTCLRKDFTFSEERSPAPGMLLAVSRVHESVPLFIVEGLKRRLGSLRGRKVAVLGLAFKADTDDERDSLSHKLIRLLERELADVAVHDPHVADADAVLRRGGPRRRRRRHRDQPHRVPRPPGPRGDRRQRQGRRGARRPVGLLRHQAGLQPAEPALRSPPVPQPRMRKRASAPAARIPSRFSSDLLALGDRAPVIRNRHFVEADPGDLQDLGGDFGLEAEVVTDEMDLTDQVTTEGLCPTSMSLLVVLQRTFVMSERKRLPT